MQHQVGVAPTHIAPVRSCVPLSCKGWLRVLTQPVPDNSIAIRNRSALARRLDSPLRPQSTVPWDRNSSYRPLRVVLRRQLRASIAPVRPLVISVDRYLKVYYWGIRFPLRPSLAFTRKSIFPSQTRRLAIAFWRLPREPASTHTLSHIVRAARQCASHTRAQHVRGRSGRAADALHLLCLQCANWRFSQHCGCVVPGCSSDSRRRPRAL